jgi:hypothetical protein
MPPRQIKAFYFIVVDDDTGAFTVEGPMADDTQWTHAVHLAQEAGRRVRCSSAEYPSADAAAADWLRAYGGTQRPSGSIVHRAQAAL